MKRIPPGPFGGAFDEIIVEHPAFVPWALLSATMLALLIATVWMLARGPAHAGKRPVRPRGFEVLGRRDRPGRIG